MKYSVQIKWSYEAAAYLASVPELPGCVAEGSSYEQAIANLRVIIAQWIDTAKVEGREIPNPRTIGDAIAEYRATSPHTRSLIRRLFDALIDIKCPHCGNKVPVVLADEAKTSCEVPASVDSQ